jgi:hypothetical protein
MLSVSGAKRLLDDSYSNRLDDRVRLPVSCEKMASGLAESYWNPANEGKGSLVSGRITRAKRSRALAAR